MRGRGFAVGLIVLAGIAIPDQCRSQSVLDNALKWQQLDLQRQQMELQRLEIERERLRLRQMQEQSLHLHEEELRRQLEFERQQAELYRKRQLERAKAKKPPQSN